MSLNMSEGVGLGRGVTVQRCPMSGLEGGRVAGGGPGWLERGSLYGEVQCRMIDRHTGLKHYLPTTSLPGGNNNKD